MGETFSIHLDEVTDAVLAAIPAASFKAMTHVHGVAINRTPLGETGNLRGESYVENTPAGADIVYPGPYARYQEFEILRHDVGQRLYLTSSIIQEAPKAIEIVAQELRKVIE
jgi:hypothetical protein